MAAKIPAVETKRCAIYTRKSHEKGLEQSFNSLDAQRETCLRYIQNQPGWRALSETYEDGGFTGKNTDRPAFQRLLADVEAGKVDVIVVYKLDRFSRSLLDFLKLQEQLDKRVVTVLSRRVKRREPTLLPGVWIGTALEKQGRGVLFACRGRALQGRHMELIVPRDDIDERAALDEEPGGLGSPEERGQM